MIRERVFELYAGAPKRDRYHLRGRWKSCPVDAVHQAVPRRGRVLEVGCGHGLVSTYLSLAAPERDVTGVDIDARKIEVAVAARARLRDNEACLTFRHEPAGEVPVGPWDAIVIVDVLYLLSRSAEKALLAACVEQLAPGGALVLKETDVRPRWKHWVAKGQEVVATKIVRITKGADLEFTPIADLTADLRALGLDTTVTPVHKGYLHPHTLIVGVRDELGRSPSVRAAEVAGPLL